jgi:hypothetical protein
MLDGATQEHACGFIVTGKPTQARRQAKVKILIGVGISAVDLLADGG